MSNLNELGLPGLYLKPLIQTQKLKSLSDNKMVNFLRLNLINSISPNPSVETLLHAYIPHKFVDHTHSNAILSIVNQKNNKNLCKKIFKNKIGMAAGFDKNAKLLNELEFFGFGHVEVGTITPKPQSGNDTPRLFRLKKDKALINRLGFNSSGAESVCSRIKNNPPKSLLGINIGPNKDTKDQKNDFCLGLKNFFDIADYITVNISSPNTEGLRDFHDQEKLKDLLLALNKIKKEDETKIPLLLKVSPDIKDNHISEIADVAIKNDISAIILTNTTNGNKDNLTSEIKKEEGGLSGEPLRQISTNMIKKFYKQLNGKIPIIGVGGVNSGKSAYEKIIAGASLLQLYTGFVYRGPSAAKDIKKELIQILKAEGIKNIEDAVGKGI